MKVIGITKDEWIEQLSLKEQDKFLELVDNIIVVGKCITHDEGPYFFINGNYPEIYKLLSNLALCKSYPQKTLFSSNYALVEIKEGMTADDLRKEWVNELRCRNLV